MFQKITTPMMVQWTFDHTGLVVGFFIRSAAGGESHFLDYNDKVALRLPFKGNWLVLSGGRSVAENHHAEYSGPALCRRHYNHSAWPNLFR